MIRIGLTGSIGMGKSTTAQMFRDEGIPVNDADAVVHELYKNEAVGPIETAFPGTTVNGQVDRQALSAALAKNPDGFQQLEKIVHPLVREKELAFFKSAEEAGADMVVADIPLLFETGGHERVDVVVVVSCDEAIQRERVLARPGMTEGKFQMIKSRQTPDSEKRARADFVIDTGLGMDHARDEVRRVIAELRTQRTN
ncbi:dephospho-CoA kinase [Rhizobium sp. L1K21]|uniref:dephospho-CoA kinase n=1 Tax=Rhizobium sp. L1K21 TaxID=2954933 RepID=UPI002093D5F1|nr:dephospho-CoA kinase [Rhizobium sp. L1K21]MCO6188002.1 dephospho-CoA kinase [Rhizobium sp. L1K21]